jgi:2-aminomuconate deaminase
MQRDFLTKRLKPGPNSYICPYIKVFKMSNNIKIESSKAPEPVGLYPHARKVGDFIYYSGIGPRERGTKKIPGVELDENGNITSYDIATQCRSVFNNLKLVVEDSGADWKNVVDVTIFLTNMKADFKTYNEIYAEYFKDNQPCRTTIEIKSLPTPIGIEIKAIAYIGK